MNREYIVREAEGKFLVLRRVKNNAGELVDIKITDILPNRPDAQAKAELGNYIVRKATEKFHELAGVR